VLADWRDYLPLICHACLIQSICEIGGKPFHDGVSPTFRFLFFDNLATQIPVQGNQLGIDHENRLALRCA